ncbi:KDGP aldolase [Abyssisolibacter fermentans]|uniref:KDGP aldolase n=1 Tax=Abyssisolibacter fermentans TaxID=1766203 RepID=UPI00082A89E1|nr:KDGP aldolase [Abyssisolibacter fermentans]
MNILKELNAINNRVILNILSFSKEEGEKICKAANNSVLLGITAHDNSVEEGVKLVKELKKVCSVISVALGGSGNVHNWKKVLKIADLSKAGHVNQPFSTSLYVNGWLREEQIVNALVKPIQGSNDKVIIQKISDKNDDYIEMNIDDAALIARESGITSIKILPVKSIKPDDLKNIVSRFAKNGIKIIEIAGGLDETNMVEYINCCLEGGCEIVIPHIFGAVTDIKNKSTDIDKVKRIYNLINC